MHFRLTVALLLASLFSQVAYCDHRDETDQITEVFITGHELKPNSGIALNLTTLVTDAGSLLQTIPGANSNTNGSITSIIQYRGLSGDRVATQLDNGQVPSGGPNAMDSPLSYMSPLLLSDFTLTRGIASVSNKGESIGGAVSARLNRGQFSQSNDISMSGLIAVQGNQNNDAYNVALRSTLANNRHKATLLAAYDDGNNTHAGNDITITGTQFERQRYDLSYANKIDNKETQVHWGHIDTRNTGTSALPMDIRFIKTDIFGLNFKTQWQAYQVKLHASYGDVEHAMNNFKLRQAPASPMQYRETIATGKNSDFQMVLENDGHAMGIEAQFNKHNADIQNPNNGAFLIDNFNDVERKLYGMFTQWTLEGSHWQHEIGLRYNRVELSAKQVSASGLPNVTPPVGLSMKENVDLLASEFNASDNDNTYELFDAVFKTHYQMSDKLQLSLGLGRKNRAPSYQERFLWLPLSATGGLADGRNYIGNPSLDHETSHEITVGLEWHNQRTYISPEFFYRRIDDYIQGVPSTNTTANMVSNMMVSTPALMFDNIDAELYGVDIPWSYAIDKKWTLAGGVNYVRGERRDLNDNLYRIPPLNTHLSLAWDNKNTQLKVESFLYSAQKKASAFNGEKTTAGYGIVNTHLSMVLAKSANIKLSVNNIFDQYALNHLGGYNRNAGSEVALGSRIPLSGRALQLGINWTF